MGRTSRIFMFVIIGVFMATFIIGSFFDYEISRALFSNKNPGSLTVSVLGNTFGYGMFGFLGGGVAFFAYKYQIKKLYKGLLFALALISYAAGVYFAGKEVFGTNGFDGVAPKFYGFLIMIVVHAAIAFVGFKVTSMSDNPHLWIVYLVLALVMIFVFLACITGVKSIMHRPRYRSVVNAGLEFYPWYERCANYKELMEIYDLTSEEFKSFPSGHSASAMVIPMFNLFLPYVNKKFTKASKIAFVVSMVWGLAVMFSRVHLGAHYLTDVSFGAMVTVLFSLIASLFLSNIKKLNAYIKNQEDLK